MPTIIPATTMPIGALSSRYERGGPEAVEDVPEAGEERAGDRHLGGAGEIAPALSQVSDHPAGFPGFPAGILPGSQRWSLVPMYAPFLPL